MDKNKIHKNSKDDWFTPLWLIKLLEKKYKLKFDYDPCGNEKSKVSQHIKNFDTITTNGLNTDWSKYNNIFVNPPFSNKKDWVDKIIKEWSMGGVNIFVLLPMSLETKSIQNLLNGGKLLIPNGRIAFEDGKNEPKTHNFASCIIFMEDINLLADRDKFEILDIKEK